MGSFSGHAAIVRAVAISADKRKLASGSDDKTVKLWDIEVGTLRCTLARHTAGIYANAVAFSPDGKLLATASEDKTTRLWDTAAGKELATFRAGDLVTLLFSPDSKTLATGSDEGLKLWDVEMKRPLASPDKAEWVPAQSAMAFSPDGKAFAAATFFRPPKLWDPATGELLKVLDVDLARPRSPSSMAFSPDGKILAIGTTQGEVKLWNVATGKGRGALKHRTGMLSKIAFWPDGNTLAVSSEYGVIGMPPEVVLWDLGTMKEICTFRPDPKKVKVIGEFNAQGFSAQAFSPDGKLWATGCADNSIKLWRIGD